MDIFEQLNQAYILVDKPVQQIIKINAFAQSLMAVSADTNSVLSTPIRQQLASKILQGDQSLTFVYEQRSYRVTCSSIVHDTTDCFALHFSYQYPVSQNLDYFFSLLDNLGAYVFCKDKNYKYTYVNQLVCELFDRPAEQIIGYDDSHFFGSETVDNLQNVVDRAVIEKGEVSKREELNYIPHLDEHRYYLAVKKPLFDEHGDLSGLFGIALDITEQKHMQARNRESEQKLSTILDNAGAYIYIKDRNLCFKYVNRRTQELLQLEAEDIIGKSNCELLGEKQGQEFSKTDSQVFSTQEKLSCIETFHTPDTVYYYWSVKIPLRNEAGDVDRYIGISTDITEQKELENSLRLVNKELSEKIAEVTALKDQMQQQATRDSLTGLLNRHAFEEFSTPHFTNPSVHGVALLMVDVDHFKKINDNYGHQIGDEVLSFIAQVMQQECRKTDLVCRFGGEEFLILLPDTQQDKAFVKAEWIRQQVMYKVQKRFPQLAAVTVSIGIAASKQTNMAFTRLYQRADKALYQAKKNGRNCTVLSS